MRPLVGQGELSRQPRGDGRVVQPVARGEPGALHGLGRGDEHHPVHPPMQPVLDEERGVVEHHGHSRPGERLGPPGHLLANPRVDDGLQRSPLGRVGEHVPPEGHPVQPPGGVHHAREPAGHLLQPRCARLHHVTRHLVRIEDVGAELAEHRRDGALARGDSAGEADHPHQRGGADPEAGAGLGAGVGTGRGAV